MKQKRQRGAASEAGGGCLLLVEAGAGGGGQEVEGIEACGCATNGQTGVGNGSDSRAASPSVFGWEGGLDRTGISRGAFNPLEGETREF